MSGFSADWLALREPLDAVSRNAELADGLRAWRQRQGALTALDLGSGTGANFRCLAPLLGGEQHWLLVDHDPALLARSDRLIRRWAAEREITVAEEARALVLTAATQRWRLERLDLNLVDGWDRLDWQNVQLVTASALIDLVSTDWLERLARRCSQWRAAVFIVLSYDGSIVWEPILEGDKALRERVNRHQRTDKGFGLALGPLAAPKLKAALERLGYRVEMRSSPWLLEPAHVALQMALLEGWVEAARQIAPEAAGELNDWSLRRRRMIERGDSRLRVGHWDLWAEPKPLA